MVFSGSSGKSDISQSPVPCSTTRDFAPVTQSGRCLSGTALTVARLKADQTFASEKERVHAFVASGGGCRATYFNHARRLDTSDIISHMTLVAVAPAANAEAAGESSVVQSN